MFYRETDPYWSEEIRSDVIGECSQLGGVVHIHIDKEDPNGCVYLKAVNSSIANACVNSLQGRWFSGLVSVLTLLLLVHAPLDKYFQVFDRTSLLFICCYNWELYTMACFNRSVTSGKMIQASYMQTSDYSKKFEGTEYLREKLERWNSPHFNYICFVIQSGQDLELFNIFVNVQAECRNSAILNFYCRCFSLSHF